MKDFEEVRLPDDISFGVFGGPEFHTNILLAVDGKEYRNINRIYPRNRYQFSYLLKSKNQIDNLITFFRARKGRAIGFRFKDYTDYQATNQLIAIADGQEKIFQLVKSYEDQIRIIKKPVNNTVRIFINNQEIFPEIDYTLGKIYFSNAPEKNAVITASFEFDVPVRFENDYLKISIDSNNYYSVKEIQLLEIIL